MPNLRHRLSLVLLCVQLVLPWWSGLCCLPVLCRLKQGFGVWIHLRVFSLARIVCVILFFLRVVWVRVGCEPLWLRICFWRYFYKPHSLRLYVLNGITGCVVRRVPESISVLQNRVTETRICEQLAFLRCLTERIFYTAKHLRSTFLSLLLCVVQISGWIAFLHQGIWSAERI